MYLVWFYFFDFHPPKRTRRSETRLSLSIFVPFVSSPLGQSFLTLLYLLSKITSDPVTIVSVFLHMSEFEIKLPS